MTFEEAIRIFKEPDRIGYNMIHVNDEDTIKYNQECEQAIFMAVHALECLKSNDFFNFDAPMVKVEDCISREDAIECVKSLYMVGFKKEDLLNVLKGLPSVTPARMRGKWVYDAKTDRTKGHCDQCGHYMRYGEKTDFCPDCGAEMKVYK